MNNTLKTYAETQGELPFDWLRWLQHVRINIGKNKLEKILHLAANWPTCACGNQCSVIPRYPHYYDPKSVGPDAPLDDNLRDLGMAFYCYVKGMRYNDYFERNRKNALETFKQIEVRSTEILKDMGVIQ